MAATWKEDIPDEVEYVQATYRGGFVYTLQRSAGRWFVGRKNALTQVVERTKYYPNMTKAAEVYEELIA
ncbi:hypothetical protein AB0C87_24900 [Actinomadura sp. NPDC048021]|uniref:hypothetical protein n=1 Tax=Actinomadura sp. NPDC048021 TaxID=3155385 RepID=UPI0033C1EAFE